MFASILASLMFAYGSFLSFGTLPQGRNVIEGRVMNAQGQAFSEVRVFLQNEVYSPITSAYTDGSGRYRFDGLASGIYYVQVEPGGLDYERQTQRVEAIGLLRRGNPSTSSEQFHVDFILKPRKIGADNRPGGVVFYQPIPNAAKKEYLKGLKSLNDDAFEKAKSSLTQAIELFPDYYDALELLGSEYVKRQQYEPAIPFLSHAIEVNKNGWRGFYSLGIAEVQTNRLGEGIVSLRRALQLNPTSPNPTMWLGIALAQRDETRNEAIEVLKKVVKLDKTDIPKAYFYLAALYLKNNQYLEAADALESLLRAAPDAGGRDEIKAKIKELRQRASQSKEKK